MDLAIHIANIRPSLKDYWEATLNSLTLLEESIGKLAQFAVCNPRLKHIYTRLRMCLGEDAQTNPGRKEAPTVKLESKHAASSSRSRHKQIHEPSASRIQTLHRDGDGVLQIYEI